MAPICFEPDGITPCQFEAVCGEGRRRLMAGWIWNDGEWRLVNPPDRGMDCTFYQQMVVERGYNAELEP